METILSVNNLSINYKLGKKIYYAVNNVTLSLNKNDSLAIVGESGCGKTTLGMSMLDLLPKEAEITDGKIYFYGRDILNLDRDKIRRVRGGKISMIFQDPLSSLNPVIKIGEQLRETLEAHGRDFSGARLAKILDAVQLKDTARITGSYPHQLSGGMRQRIMIAQALCSEPEILIADEPTTALDVTTQKEILDLLKNLISKFNLTLVFITHNFSIISELCSRIAVMYAGEIVEEGALGKIFKSPRHPYTKELISIVAGRGSTGGKFSAIPGEAPDLSRLPAGCYFAPRCKRRIEKCGLTHPQIEYGEGGGLRCFNPYGLND